MGDRPHKTGPDALEEMRSLSLDTRRHIYGLFERHTEGLIIQIGQFLLVGCLVGYAPELTGIRKGIALGCCFLYVAFSAFWSVRSVYDIQKEVHRSMTPDEIREGQTYDRYCEGGWFLRTIGGVFVATVGLATILWCLALT